MAAKKVMLVNALDPDEVRVAVLVGKDLDELYVETRSRGPTAGSIYKGVVSNYERTLEAAFVDIGVGKHGFLHVSDASAWPGFGEQGRAAPPENAEGSAATGSRSRRRSAARTSGGGAQSGSKRGGLAGYLVSGREVLVQVKKESQGEKGPALTSFIGMPGRYLVLMPSLGRIGVSRRIRDRKTRDELKGILAEIRPPRDVGFVIRTEAKTTNARELRHDAEELIERWRRITELAADAPAPSLLWEEAGLTVRALRDYLAADTSEVWIDEPGEHERARRFIEESIPELAASLRLYEGAEPLFVKFGVESQMGSLVDRKVALPGGGHLIVEQTEAMVVVDVNSGRSRKRKSVESMIRQTNLEAAREVTRQLRLRDLGGLVVIDFIDMENAADRKLVEDEVKAGLERDKARSTVLPISDLGILEMTRQRRRPGLERRTGEACRLCRGRGFVRSTESLSVAFLRELRSRLPDVHAEAGRAGTPMSVVGRFHPERALAVSNRLRSELAAFEAASGVQVAVRGDASIGYGGFEIEVVRGRAIPHARGWRPEAPAGAAPAAPSPEAARAAPSAEPVLDTAREGAPSGPAARKKSRKGRKKKRRGKRGGRRRSAKPG